LLDKLLFIRRLSSRISACLAVVSTVCPTVNTAAPVKRSAWCQCVIYITPLGTSPPLAPKVRPARWSCALRLSESKRPSRRARICFNCLIGVIVNHGPPRPGDRHPPNAKQAPTTEERLPEGKVSPGAIPQPAAAGCIEYWPPSSCTYGRCSILMQRKACCEGARLRVVRSVTFHRNQWGTAHPAQSGRSIRVR
jgi:hypothetical protein